MMLPVVNSMVKMKLVLLTAIIFHCTSMVQPMIAPTKCPAINFEFNLSLQMCKVPTSSGRVTRLSREDSLKIEGLYPQLFRPYYSIYDYTNSRRSPALLASRKYVYYTSCCKTYTTHVKETFMRNTNGVQREMVQLTKIGKYQFVTKGRCGRCPAGHYCVPQTTIQYFMVYNEEHTRGTPPLTIEGFTVPTYCECYRTSWFRYNIKASRSLASQPSKQADLPVR